MYSQHDEELYILDFFKNKETGTLLEIGAYHPELFSNSRALILKGWEAFLVEASPECFDTIYNFYKRNSKVHVYNTALNNYDGNMIFYNSSGAVATGRKQHYDIWKNIQKDFVEIEIPCLCWKTFYNYIFNKKFDFISIDIEGMDFEVLKQIDLDETGTSLVCIEHTYELTDIIDYLAKYNFSVIHTNGENLIVGR